MDTQPTLQNVHFVAPARGRTGLGSTVVGLRKWSNGQAAPHYSVMPFAFTAVNEVQGGFDSRCEHSIPKVSTEQRSRKKST